jgi:hypothetical protein
MEKLESAIRQRESEFIVQVRTILSSNGSSKTKMTLIYSHYIKTIVAIEDLVNDATVKQVKPLWNM